jgi:two-component system, cell cycle sensor histidine kinase and response regulator CckA
MPQTILVVDDEYASRRVAGRILREAEYRVLEAENADEALETMRHTQGRVELILMDVVMPGVDGVELAARILEEWPDKRILFMSAFPIEIVAKHGLDFREVFFLQKPFTRGLVLERVKEVIGRPRFPVSLTRDQPAP